MRMFLEDTSAAAVSHAMLDARRRAGSPTMGMVMTLVMVVDSDADVAMKAATDASMEHPSRIVCLVPSRARKGSPRLDAEVRIGEGSPGEHVVVRAGGAAAAHMESVVVPLLLPDTPVVVWWPQSCPPDPAADPVGALGHRRITDVVRLPRGRTAALLAQAASYAPGNTDLAWTRITGWRALLASAMDQFPCKVTGAEVSAERGNPSANLMAAWLADRLAITVTRKPSRGPGLTDVRLHSRQGDVALTRPDGTLATFTVPGHPDRPVALQRRDTAELLAEELRRMDEDDIYAATVARLLRDSASAVPAER